MQKVGYLSIHLPTSRHHNASGTSDIQWLSHKNPMGNSLQDLTGSDPTGEKCSKLSPSTFMLIDSYDPQPCFHGINDMIKFKVSRLKVSFPSWRENDDDIEELCRFCPVIWWSLYDIYFAFAFSSRCDVPNVISAWKWNNFIPKVNNVRTCGKCMHAYLSLNPGGGDICKWDIHEKHHSTLHIS